MSSVGTYIILKKLNKRNKKFGLVGYILIGTFIISLLTIFIKLFISTN